MILFIMIRSILLFKQFKKTVNFRKQIILYYGSYNSLWLRHITYHMCASNIHTQLSQWIIPSAAN